MKRNSLRLLLVGWAATIVVGTANAESSKPGTFIVGGVEASIGEFPFIVSLHSGSSHFCGGSLIKKNWVLTAAHCVRGGSVSKVVIGLHNQKDLKNAEQIRPKRIIAHPAYNSSTIDYDFALIELSKDSNYAPIALSTFDYEKLPEGEVANFTVAGWGATNENSWGLPDKLQKVDVPFVNQAACKEAYDTITDRMICAGFPEGKKDSCQGDSGGPMISVGADGPALVGIVSWGEGCARPKKYGVYSNVSSMIDWIEKTAQ